MVPGKRLFASVSAAAVVLAVLGGPRPARAHQSSTTYSNLRWSDDQRSLSYRLRIATTDLGEALGLGTDAQADARAIVAGSRQIHDYVLERILFRASDAVCASSDPSLALIEMGGVPWAELTWQWRCDSPVPEWEIRYNLFFDLDALHQAPVELVADGARSSTVFRAGQRVLSWPDAHDAPTGFVGFWRSGIDHILYGFDHLLFLLSLLVVLPLAAAGLRTAPNTLRRAAGLVSAFTLAHSITLVAAALGAIPIPARLVESVIGLSIAVAAAENLWRMPRHRYALTVGFGLLHGLGFASMLRELLPSEGLLGPVVAFNLGVETGQLAVVAVVVPILFVLGRVLGPLGYRRRVLAPVCVALVLVGTLWAFERALGLSFMPL